MRSLLLAGCLLLPLAASAEPLTGEGLLEFARAQLEPIPGFTGPEQRSACGLIAAEALMRFFYRDPELDVIGDLKRVARARGLWSVAGMAGPEAERELLANMGRDARVVEAWIPGWRAEADPALAALEARVVDALERGYPVLLSTGRHYFVIEGHDRAGAFYVGNTGRVMEYRGLGAGPWMTLASMAKNGDVINGLLVPAEASDDAELALLP